MKEVCSRRYTDRRLFVPLWIVRHHDMDRLVTPAFDPEELKRLLKTELPTLEGSCSVRHILTDSRSLVSPQDTLFVAIPTESGDGHRYVAQLYERGVRSFVVERLPDEARRGEWQANWFVVPSSVKALQQIAALHRARFPQLETIGITGSNGKTTRRSASHYLYWASRHQMNWDSSRRASPSRMR